MQNVVAVPVETLAAERQQMACSFESMKRAKQHLNSLG
jgi:hypothetical protein